MFKLVLVKFYRIYEHSSADPLDQAVIVQPRTPSLSAEAIGAISRFKSCTISHGQTETLV